MNHEEARSIARRDIIGKGLQNTCWSGHDHCSPFLKGPCGLNLIKERTATILQDARLQEAHRELEREREGGKYLAEIVGRLDKDIEEAEQKAWDALGRYKFQMYGYWSAIWVHLNKIRGGKRSNPWREIVRVAAFESESKEGEADDPN